MINQLNRVVSVAAMSMAVLSYGNDSEVVESEDKWTHSPHFSEMIEHWREAGNPDLPVSSLPDGVADQLGIESETVPPEVLFSNEMQALLSEKLSPPNAQRVFPGSVADIDSNALLQVFLLPDVDLEELKQRYAEHLGLQSADELSPLMIELVRSLYHGVQHFREEMAQSDALLYGQQFQGDMESHGIDLDTPIKPNYTEDDYARAWNALSAEDQQILEPLRHLRDQKNVFSVRLSATQQDAGSRYIRNLNAVKPHPLTAYFKQQMMLIKEEKELRNRELGYSDRTTKIAPTASARETIESVIMDSFSLSAYNSGDETVYHLNSPEATNLTSSLSSVPAEYLESGSQNYLIQRHKQLRRFYSDTVFGGSLLIKQQSVSGGDVLFANATIAGRDAKVISALYSNEDWNTVISAVSDIHMHHIYAEGRLEGDKLEKLVKLAEHLVESANIGLLD